MTRKCVTDEQYGRLSRRLDELKRRVDEGTLPFERVMADAQSLIEGITLPSRVITGNWDKYPFTPDGWTVKSHKSLGKIEWGPNNIELYQSEKQKGDWTINGKALFPELEQKTTLHAGILDYLLIHQSLIPVEWSEYCLIFWGTIYDGFYEIDRKVPRHLRVMCLSIHYGVWTRISQPADGCFGRNCMAVCLKTAS